MVTATFASGGFRGLEFNLSKLAGVPQPEVGYMGGITEADTLLQTEEDQKYLGKSGIGSCAI